MLPLGSIIMELRNEASQSSSIFGSLKLLQFHPWVFLLPKKGPKDDIYNTEHFQGDNHWGLMEDI